MILLVSVAVPVLYRTLQDGPTVASSFVPGDVEARAYAVLSRNVGATSRQLALVGGVRGPTAPIQLDARGAALPAELQPGCGALVPYLGLAYAVGGRWITGEASATLTMPFSIRDGPHAGDSLRAAAWMQIEPTSLVGTRFGMRVQLDSTGELSQGVTNLNSGGFIGYVTTDAIASPWMDVVVSVGAAFPLVQALMGEHRESTIASVQLAYDF